MPTAMNTTVKVYKGVPLIKGGTEVLYLAQGAAEGVLSAYLEHEYTEYYYTRENRGAIQVHDVIQNLEGCNYVSFKNLSHGGKIFFGFIDQIVYINDNNTEIHFTVDPFPTYIGDTKHLEKVYVKRNTPETDSESLIAPDFENCGRPYTYEVLDTVELTLNKIICVFTPGRLQQWDDQGTIVADVDSSNFGSPLTQYGNNTGIRYMVNPLDSQIKVINQSGGSIIGIYAVDGNFDPGNLTYESLSGTVTQIGGIDHLKLSWSGQYNKLYVVGCGQSREYEISKFNSPQSAFNIRIKRYMNPIPTLCIYPELYEGQDEATSEGIVIQYPTLATAVSNGDVGQAVAGLGRTIYNKLGAAYYDAGTSQGWDYGDSIINAGQNTIGDNSVDPRNAGTNTAKGLAYMLTGGILNAGVAVVKGIKATFNSIGNIRTALRGMRQSEITTSAGALVLTTGNKMVFRLVKCRPNIRDLEAMDDYMDYFGYAFNEVRIPNLADKAYLQTGQPFVYGSEADEVLNSYFMNGIKIRHTLTNPPEPK